MRRVESGFSSPHRLLKGEKMREGLNGNGTELKKTVPRGCTNGVNEEQMVDERDGSMRIRGKACSEQTTLSFQF